MSTTAAPGGELLRTAAASMMEDIRLRSSLLGNAEWRRQMEESHAYFASGAKGRTLSDIGRE
jgi:hypothetical protein